MNSQWAMHEYKRLVCHVFKVHYLAVFSTTSSSSSKNMLTKVIILAYLVALTKQEPSVVAAPYVANYASSYDSHAINHDIRVPVAPLAPLVKAAPIAPLVNAAPAVQAITAYSPASPLIKAAPIAQVAPLVNAAPAVPAITAYSPAIAPLTSAIPQVVSAYSPAIASYSLAPVGAAPLAAAQFAPVSPLTSAIAPAVTKAAPLPAANPIQAPIAPAVARSNPNPAPAESEEQNKPSRSTLLPENPVNPAILLASQFLSRNIAPQQNRPADPRTPPQGGNPQETEATQQSRASNLPQDQRNAPTLGATPTGFGLIQRNNARFAQIPLQQGNNQIQRADLRSGQPLAAQRSAPSAKLIRENEDSESVEVNSANDQAYEPGRPAAKGQIVPGRLATLTPSVGIVPNVYTSYIAF